MVPCCYSPISSPASLSKFISEQPSLFMLDKNCTSMKDLQKIHVPLIKTGLTKDPLAASRVLAFCTSHAGDINYAYLVFKQMQNPNLFVWNTIIRGFSQSSTPQNAIFLFTEMLFTTPSTQPHRLTYPSVFKACAQLGLAHEGAQLHGRVIKLGLENDKFIRNTILYMYVNCGFLSEAQRIFDGAMEFDVVTWNTMIMGLAKCGHVDKSRKLFDGMLMRNAISWNSMISGYVRRGRFTEALQLFSRMQEERIKPSEFTMVSLLNACACLGALRQGVWIHDCIVRNNLEWNAIVATAIIDMYSKCGSIHKAVQAFKSAPRKGLSCWNSLILGLAMNGHENEAIQLFSMLDKSSTFKPDAVSFIGILTACNHCGMVNKAKEFFLLMTEKYKIRPSIKHYSCMVDVIGQAGLLEEAEVLIRSTTVNPDAVIWGSLLSACRKYGNIQMAKRAAKHVTELDPTESSGFVLLSNIYAACSHFGEAMQQRVSLKEKQIGRDPGCSMIEVNGEVHEFVAGERLHPKSQEIYHALDDLGLIMKEMGIKIETKSNSFSISDTCL